MGERSRDSGTSLVASLIFRVQEGQLIARDIPLMVSSGTFKDNFPCKSTSYQLSIVKRMGRIRYLGN
jgi:hypothetical protein